MAYNLGWIDIQENVDTGATANLKIKNPLALAETALNELDIGKMPSIPASIALLPQEEDIDYVEGTFFYRAETETYVFYGPYPGISVEPGHGEHMHVVNNSGDTIEAGMAVRPDGISGGEVQVVKALADTFDNARVLGVAVVDIPNGEKSAIAISGFIININTNGLALGTPMFLSNTVPGTYSATAPAIRTQIGGVFVADAELGKLYIRLVNNQNIPTVFGGLKGQAGTGIYDLTTIKDINDYALEKEIVTSVTKATGVITLPEDGDYRASFTAGISFTSTTSTRTVYVELYDITNDDIHYTYPVNIPRDATEDSISFQWPITDELAGVVHKMRIRASVAMNVTLTSASFDIESINLK